MNRLKTLRIVCATLLCWLGGALASAAPAAEIATDLSQRETFVGVPVTLRIEIRGADEYEQPELPEIEGLEIEPLGAPSQSSRISIVNGRRSEETTVTFAYRLTPQREGTFTISPITVTADGLAQMVAPVRVVASEGEASDLLIAEVETEQTEVYVGEPVELTLRIWVRPFSSEEYEVVLSEGDMWSLIAEQTQWGAFQPRLEELAEENRRPRGREVIREDNEQHYYLYEIDATIYPKRPGPIDADSVRVVVRYPTELGRSTSPLARFFDDDFPLSRFRRFGGPFSSPFGARLTIRSTQPVLAEAAVEPIEAQPIPTAGRPPDFRGAVGQYEIAAEASPTEVAAGDPITLRLGITGTGPMDLVRAPPLSELPELTADFQAADEALPGLVEGDRKIFSTTIRPRRAGITEIPPIPFTYFDPETEEFVTVRSDPVPVRVRQAQTLALDAVVAGGEPAGGDEEEASAEAADGDAGAELSLGPVLQHARPSAALLEHHEVVPMWSWRWLAAVAVPPLVVLLLALVRYRRAVGASLSTIGSPTRRCRRRIGRADHAGQVAAALRALVARQYRLTPDQANSAAVVGVLRASGERDSAIALERVLGRCERTARAGFSSGSPELEELKQEARRWVDHSPRRPQRPLRRVPAAAPPVSGTTRGGSGVTGMILLALALHSAPAAPEAQAAQPSVRDNGVALSTEQAVALSPEQQERLLEEALRYYQQARRQARQGDAAASSAFEMAVDRYQAVVDSGVQNSELYFYLGNAHLQSGRLGRAIANYRRALRLRPGEARYQRNLRFAEGASSSDASAVLQQVPGTGWAGGVSARLGRWISLSETRAIALAGWIVLWVAIALRIGRVPFPWKSAAILGLVVAMGAGTVYASRYHELTRPDVAVLVADAVTLRQGDGEAFPAVGELSEAEGELVKLLDRRAGWARIRVGSGATGWVPEQVIEAVAPPQKRPAAERALTLSAPHHASSLISQTER